MVTIVSQTGWEQLITAGGSVSERIYIDTPPDEILRINSAPNFTSQVLDDPGGAVVVCAVSVVEVCAQVYVVARDHTQVFARGSAVVRGADWSRINACQDAAVSVDPDFGGSVRFYEGAVVAAQPGFDVAPTPLAAARPMPEISTPRTVAVIGDTTGATYWAETVTMRGDTTIALVPPYEMTRMQSYGDVPARSVISNPIGGAVLVALDSHQLAPLTQQIAPIAVFSSTKPQPIHDMNLSTPAAGVGL